MKAFIIFDDRDSATGAIAALKRAAWSANVNADWDIQPWRTDALKFPSVAAEALIEAADSDLIVFAGPQACSPPTWLEEWLRCWVIRREVEDAALAVFYNEGARVLVVPDAPRLSQFAERHGLSLIKENQTTPEDQTLPFARSLSVHKWPVSPPRKLGATKARGEAFCYRAGNI